MLYNILLTITIILFSTGTCVVIPCIILFHIDSKEEKCEEETIGKVVSYKKNRKKTFTPIIRYEVEDVKYEIPMRPDIFIEIKGVAKIGDNFPVFYDKENPHNAYVLRENTHLIKFILRDIATFICSLGTILGIVTYLINVLH